MRHVGLDEERRSIGVEPEGQQVHGSVESVPLEDLTISDGGQGVQVGNEIKSLIGIALQIDVLPDGAEIVSPVETACRLDTGENSHREFAWWLSVVCGFQRPDHVSQTLGAELGQGPRQGVEDFHRDGRPVEVRRADLDGAGPGDEKFHDVVDAGYPSDSHDRNADRLRRLVDGAQGDRLDCGATEPAHGGAQPRRRRRQSIAIPRQVLIREIASAPPASAARAIESIRVTFGVSLASTGREHALRTPATTRSHIPGSVPKSTPPETLGQETFSSKPATPGTPSRRAARAINSS